MNPLIQTLGAALVHFVWQGAAIAVAAAAVLWLLRSAAPQVRYVVGCGALAAMLLAPLATAILVHPRQPSADVAVEWMIPIDGAAAFEPVALPDASAPAAIDVPVMAAAPSFQLQRFYPIPRFSVR